MFQCLVFFWGDYRLYIYTTLRYWDIVKAHMNSGRIEWDRDFIVASFDYGSERGCLILGACESREFFFLR